jgi:beta-N-acetylhexosaminidase
MNFTFLRTLFFCLFFYWALPGCNTATNKPPEIPSNKQAVALTTPADTLSTQISLLQFYSNNSRIIYLTDSIYAALSDDEKAAQLIMPAVSDVALYKFPFNTALRLYKKHLIGGILFLKNKKETVVNQTTQLRKLEDSLRLFPLIFSCDGEPALFHRKFTDADSLPKANEQISIQDVTTVTTSVSKQIKAMNLNWNFAPVADVAFNEAIIGKRSFGTNPADVINKCCTFITTSNGFNIATCIKHFPGHGDVVGDSHKGLVTINGDFKELDDFKKIIDSINPLSVMIGHIAVNNLTKYNTKGQPSSISKNIVTGLLKDSFHFKGLIVTDAMSMGAVKNIPDADEKAISAGVDLVIMPQNPVKLHTYIKSLLKNPNTKREIGESVKKIIRLKICLGIIPVKN